MCVFSSFSFYVLFWFGSMFDNTVDRTNIDEIFLILITSFFFGLTKNNYFGFLLIATIMIIGWSPKMIFIGSVSGVYISFLYFWFKKTKS